MKRFVKHEATVKETETHRQTCSYDTFEVSSSLAQLSTNTGNRAKKLAAPVSVMTN